MAELGAFSSEKVIQSALRVIISEDHNQSESFVRYGPIRRIENIDRERIGVFPWRSHKNNGSIVKASISPHYREILGFINAKIEDIPDSYLYRTIEDQSIFYDILWILSLLEAVPPLPLYEAVRIIHPDASDEIIRNKLFVMQTCGWVKKFSYAGRDFYFLPENKDPYHYSFIQGRRVRDVSATKLGIVAEFQQGANVGRAILQRLLEKRGEAP